MNHRHVPYKDSRPRSAQRLKTAWRPSCAAEGLQQSLRHWGLCLTSPTSQV